MAVRFLKSNESSNTPDNPVRLLDAFVGSLDLAALGLTKARCAQTGRPPCDSAAPFKLCLYRYQHQLRSSPLLEAECHRNVELIWLVRKLTPDFKTTADFRKDKQAWPASTALRAKRIGSRLSLVPQAGPVRRRTVGH